MKALPVHQPRAALEAPLNGLTPLRQPRGCKGARTGSPEKESLRPRQKYRGRHWI